METFMTAYVVVGLVVMLYVGRLGVRQRRLQHTLDELQENLPLRTNGSKQPVKAAS